MKKLFLSALLLLGLVMTPLATVGAQFDPTDQACTGAAANSSVCKADGENDPIAGQEGILLRVVGILSYVVGAASLIVIIYAGLKYVLANGDATSITTARNAILYALIGVVVFTLSQIIIRFLLGKL